ncbi:hypothetical protein BaRGS_00004669 [Batillaria attramentaria]|uniref:Uncharacterized protein n=1 Tax=Batillaria attramentaria TaxID=370345 RepID=A0ABD0LY94_9CAEN
MFDLDLDERTLTPPPAGLDAISRSGNSKQVNTNIMRQQYLGFYQAVRRPRTPAAGLRLMALAGLPVLRDVTRPEK